MIKNKVNSFSKVSIIAFVVGIALIGIATYAVFNKPATAQVLSEGEVTISVKGSALNTFLCALGLCNTPEVAVGAFAGPDIYQRLSLREGVASGGRIATTSPGGLTTYTTSAVDFYRTPTYIDWLPDNDITISLSGTSTFAYIPNVGDMAKIVWRNASTTAAATITFAAEDSGVDLQFAEATGGDLVLNGLDWAELTLIRESTFLVSILLNEFTEAD